MSNVQLEQQSIRARVDSPFGSIETPYVLSFYVNKTRNQLDSFNCSLKVSSSKGPIESDDASTVTISAGVGIPRKIYTGYIMSVNARPCFEDPDYFIVDISGTDARKFLEGKSFTRRQKIENKSWVEITSVNNKGIKSSKLKHNNKTDFATQSIPKVDINDMFPGESTATYLNRTSTNIIDDSGVDGFLDIKVVYRPADSSGG